MNMKKLTLSVLILIMAIFFWSGCRSLGGSKPENLIIILVDSLRWDHVGAYGYARNITPNMDRFASKGLIFDQAISQSGWTPPAVMALFSSNYPRPNLNDSRTFSQWLSEHHYQTAAFTANHIMIEELGYHRGFQTYELRPWLDAAALSDLSLAWIRARDVSRPFCLYIHYMDVHDPYQPPPPYDSMFGEGYGGRIDGHVVPFKEQFAEKKSLDLTESELQRLQNLYDGGIAYLDHQLGVFLENLKDAGVYDESIIVVLSDHGDEFMEHGGIGHGHTVFEELIRIPLMIQGPRVKKGRYSGLFELIDLAPTLMEMLNIPFDYDVAGQSYLRALRRNRPVKEMAFSEVFVTMGYNAGNYAVGLRTDSKKLIYYPDEKRYAFYDLSENPIEGDPIQTDMTGFVRTLAHSLHKWHDAFSITKHENSIIDKKYLEALRSLGYLK